MPPSTLSGYMNGVEPGVAFIAQFEAALGLRAGTIYIAAGIVTPAASTLEAIELDHELAPGIKEMVAAAYKTGVAETKKRRARRENGPS